MIDRLHINVSFLSTLQNFKMMFQGGEGKDWESLIFLQIMDYLSLYFCYTIKKKIYISLYLTLLITIFLSSHVLHLFWSPLCFYMPSLCCLFCPLIRNYNGYFQVVHEFFCIKWLVFCPKCTGLWQCWIWNQNSDIFLTKFIGYQMNAEQVIISKLS